MSSDVADSVEIIIKQMEILEWALRGIVAPCNNEGDAELFDPVKIANIALNEVAEIRWKERERLYGVDARRFVYNERRVLENLK
jgi:hypothetical protein